MPEDQDRAANAGAGRVEQIRQDLRDIRIFCGRYFPFLVIPLSYAPVIASEEIPTAGVDERGVLVVNPKWWATLQPETKRFVAIHEVLHLALLHPFRVKGYDRMVYNFAADGKVNDAVEEARIPGIRGSEDFITLNTLATVTGIQVMQLKKMSTEEIASALERKGHGGIGAPEKGGQGGGEQGTPSLSDDLLGEPLDGEVVQAGGLPRGASRERLREAWKAICDRALSFAKQAGNIPTGLERLVSEVLEVKPPWYITLRFGLGSGKVDASYAKTSRRGDEYPGWYGYERNVWCLIDTSGSIGEEELRTFLGIVKHEARSGRVFVIPWDAEAYEVLKAEKPADVARKVAMKMKGGGGTVCLPALQKVYGLMNWGDAVIMLTDGDIFDIEKEETRKWLGMVSSRAGFAMVGYTTKPVDAPGFLTANIRVIDHERG